MASRNRLWGLSTAMLAAGALLLAGCGSSDEGGESGGGDTATSQAAGSGSADDSATADASGDSGSGEAPAADTTAAVADVPEGDYRFIYITNDPIGVNKFLELGKIGTENAAEAYGGSAKIYESTDVVSQQSNLDAAVAEAPDVIVMITFDFTDLAQEYAEDNPDQQFLLIDACPSEPAENLHCAVFREYEASYLIGVEAGMLTESDKTGSVVSQDIPFLHRYSDAFAEGVQSVNPDATDQQLFIGGENPFSDPAKAKEQALALAATGADQIFAVGAGSNGGVFEAAEAKDFFTYGVDVNQCPDAPGHIVDSTLKAVDVLVVSEIGKILTGTAEPVSSYGLAEKGMDVVSQSAQADGSKCVAMEHQDVLDKVAEVKQSIVDGTLTLEDPAAG